MPLHPSTTLALLTSQTTHARSGPVSGRCRRSGWRAHRARPVRRRPPGHRHTAGQASTARAPSATALNTSAPRRMPLSNSTVVRSPTASATPGKASSAGKPPSSWRPPWLETITPATPCIYGPPRIVGMQHAFHQHRQPRRLAEPAQVVPGARGVGEDLAEILECSQPDWLADRRRRPFGRPGR